MSTLSADNRLREKVGSVDGTVILVGAGHVDRVIRFTKLPASLVPFKTKFDGESIFPVMLNLDRGPDQEAWAQARREAFVSARRDRPMPEPLQVSATTSEGWSVDVEDVPVVEFNIDSPSAVKAIANSLLTCETCTQDFPTEKGLKIHQTRTKHV